MQSSKIVDESIQKLEKLAEKLAAVYELSREMTLSADIDHISDAVLDIAQKALNFDNCALLLIDESTNELYTQAQRGYSDEIEKIRLPMNYDKGITPSVARTGKSIYLPDVSQNGRYIPGVPGGRSELAVPVEIGGKVIGVLDVESKGIDAFLEEDQKLLSCLASQTALAIQNARNFEEVRRGSDELGTLYDIAIASTSTLKLNEVLRVIYGRLNQLMGISSFHIALYNEAEGEIRFEYVVDAGEPQEKVICRLSEGCGPTGWIVQTGKSLLIRDWENELERFPVSPIVIGKSKVPRSWLGVPLITKDKLIGVMATQSYEPNAFDEQDKRVLSVIANQVAITVENARLFTEDEKKTEQLSLLLNASTAFSSTLSLNQILHNLAEKLTTSLPTTCCIVALLDERMEELTIGSTFAIRPLEWEPNIGGRYPVEAKSYFKPCVKEAETLVLRADENKEELLEFVYRLALRNGIQSLLCVPLVTGSKVLGMAWLGEMRSWKRSSFTSEKVNVCRGIADRGAIAIENALLHEQLRENHAYLRSEVEERYKFGNIIGKSLKMRKVYKLLEIVKNSLISVLIEGETGTGKEVVAKAIHFSGPRCHKRFVPVDCGAIPETLVESELFGYKKGAFTDAREDKKGLFEEADGGTLFLDEIGNMNPSMQAKLLRVLQEGEIMRLGETRPRKVDVRVISATSKDLEVEVRKGKFREDLLFRLNVVTVKLPSLRERLEDIPLLANHFLKKYSERENKVIVGFSPRAMNLLMNYDYPRNNVRELENIVERAVVMERSKIITQESLSFIEDKKTFVFKPKYISSLQDVEKDIILKTLQHTGWNKKKSCAILGISRPTLDRKLRKYKITRKE